MTKVQQDTWHEKCSLQRGWLFKLHKLLIKSVWQLPCSVLLGEAWVLIILFFFFLIRSAIGLAESDSLKICTHFNCTE